LKNAILNNTDLIVFLENERRLNIEKGFWEELITYLLLIRHGQHKR
jgi:hypothetical protein